MTMKKLDQKDLYRCAGWIQRFLVPLQRPEVAQTEQTPNQKINGDTQYRWWLPTKSAKLPAENLDQSVVATNSNALNQLTRLTSKPKWKRLRTHLPSNQRRLGSLIRIHHLLLKHKLDTTHRNRIWSQQNCNAQSETVVNCHYDSRFRRKNLKKTVQVFSFSLKEDETGWGKQEIIRYISTYIHTYERRSWLGRAPNYGEGILSLKMKQKKNNVFLNQSCLTRKKLKNNIDLTGDGKSSKIPM